MSSPDLTGTDAIDAVRARLANAGVHARRLRRVLLLLAEGTEPLDRLVRLTAVPRRTVEELLTSAGSDIESDHVGYRLAPSARIRYRERFALHDLDFPDEPTGLSETAVLESIRDFVDSGPRPLAALDHVTATPDTVLRRAEWLRDNYDLAGARVLFLGDHDLTSLALGLVAPSTSITVVDVDDRILAHIDHIATEHDLPVRTSHADLRFGLPPSAAQAADLVFTDPPYTPEGIGLFAARAAEAVADASARVLIAYGFSDRSPALGHKVQQELLRMGMVFEAILPNFHRYLGAQAIGSASDLYVCLPTSRTRKLALRHGIYTHGPRSVESREGSLSPEFLRAVGDRVDVPITGPRAPGWSRPMHDPAPDGTAVAFDLRGDPGPWLLRMLLACNAELAVFVLGNHHPDITSESAQRELSELVAAKYTLRFVRSTPDSGHALVIASESGSNAADRNPMREVLRRAHGKLGNTWREALIADSDETLSQREANQRVRQRAPNPPDLALRLIDLPRHRIAAVLHANTKAMNGESLT